jgi:hypothetical protein
VLIEEGHALAGRGGHARVSLCHDTEARIREGADDGHRAVGRAVVDHDHLDVPVGLGEHTLDGLTNLSPLKHGMITLTEAMAFSPGRPRPS